MQKESRSAAIRFIMLPPEKDHSTPGKNTFSFEEAAAVVYRQAMNLTAAHDCSTGQEEKPKLLLPCAPVGTPETGVVGGIYQKKKQGVEQLETTSLEFVSKETDREHADDSVMMSASSATTVIRSKPADGGARGGVEGLFAEEGEGSRGGQANPKKKKTRDQKRCAFDWVFEGEDAIADAITKNYDSDVVYHGDGLEDSVNEESGSHSREQDDDDDDDDDKASVSDGSDAKSRESQCYSGPYAHETFFTSTNMYRFQDPIYDYASTSSSSSSPTTVAAASSNHSHHYCKPPPTHASNQVSKYYSSLSASLKKLHLILRTGAALFSLITVAVMFSTSETRVAGGNTFLVKFTDVQAYSYLVAFNILSFLYSIGQLLISRRRERNVLSSPIKGAAWVYVCDQMLAFLLASCSSSAATASALSHNGLRSIWPPACSTWKLWMFCSKAYSAVVMSFFSYLFVLISSFFSGYHVVVLLRE